MTSIDRLRAAMLALPETDEGTHLGMVAFSVRGKGFGSVTKDGWLQLQLSDDDVAAIVAKYDAAEPLTRRGTLIGVRVPLTDVSEAGLEAWCRTPGGTVHRRASRPGSTSSRKQKPTTTVVEKGQPEPLLGHPCGRSAPIQARGRTHYASPLRPTPMETRTFRSSLGPELVAGQGSVSGTLRVPIDLWVSRG